ncbi:MAG: AAA family ATPase [Clostridia bacterium]|nr:AAA family ATPase [Clostridia bacterium]
MLKLRRVCFTNFGILRDQIMEDIHPGLVIIAGPNRAGKTTMMTALRYLGYGLPKRDFIPPPLAGQHDYNADVNLQDLGSYNIHILGNSKPKVSPITGSGEITAGEIYNNLDGFTYRQIFTISLDELRRIPEGLSSGDEQQLQVVLLGGGWVDALRLAEFKKEFDKNAGEIGGTRGTKNVWKFKPSWEKVHEGIAERNEANKELETYYEKERELEKLKDEKIPHIENELEKFREEKETLEVIKDHYDKYDEMLRLDRKLKQKENDHLLTYYPEDGRGQGERLKEEYEAAVDEYQSAVRDFSNAVGLDDPNVYLDKESILQDYSKNLSGWQEKLRSYLAKKDDYHGEEKTLRQKLGQLNSQWNDNLGILENITADRVNKENLQQDVELYKKSLDGIEQVSTEKKQALAKLKIKQKEKDEYLEGKKSRPRALPLLVGGSLIIFLLLVFINPMAALGAGFILAAGIIVYFQYYRLKEKEFNLGFQSIEGEIAGLEDELSDHKVNKDGLEKNLEVVRDRLSNVVKCLNLPADTPYSRLSDFYRDIMDLKEKYQQWMEDGMRLEALNDELREIFKSITGVLVVLGLDVPKINEGFDFAEKIFDTVERAVSNLKLAEILEEAASSKAELEVKITSLLRKEDPDLELPEKMESMELMEMLVTFIHRGEKYEELADEAKKHENLRIDLETSLSNQRRKELLLGNGEQEDILLAFDKYFNSYSSISEIEAEYNEIGKEITDLNDKWGVMLEKKAALEAAVHDLSSDKKLQDALQKISKGKNELEALAEQYATYRLAEFMIEKVHEKFIAKTKGTILDYAGEIFKKITSQEYDGITIPDTMSKTGESLDFEVGAGEFGKEKISKTSHQLSRATREQLFLSVRLSRIYSMKPLPVIFDDSLVNFDPLHSKQAAQLIARMSETHQVFVLTCHPQFISTLLDHAGNAQCWGLDAGRIKGPFDDGSCMEDVMELLDP